MNEIFNILNWHLYYNQILDEQAINNIIYLYVKEMNLFDVVKDIRFGPIILGGNDQNTPPWPCLGIYDDKTYTIGIDRNLIYQDANNILNSYCIDFVYKDRVAFINLEILSVIFHELAHAIQLKGLKENTKPPINKILNELIKERGNNINGIRKYHWDFPFEKFANFYSLSCIMTLISWFDESMISNFVFHHHVRKFYDMLLIDYDMDSFLDNPLKKLMMSQSKSDEDAIDKLKKYNKYKKSILSSNMPLHERVLLNFPITKEEYDRILMCIYNFRNSCHDRRNDVRKMVLGG